MKATNGDTSLGGEDFDHAIVKFLVDEFKKSQGAKLMERPSACGRLDGGTLSGGTDTGGLARLDSPDLSRSARPLKYMKCITRGGCLLMRQGG